MKETIFRELPDLLDQISMPNASSNGTEYEKAKAELLAKCSNEISSTITILYQSIQKSSESNDKLGRKIFWLNIILAIATSIGAVATVIIAAKCQ